MRRQRELEAGAGRAPAGGGGCLPGEPESLLSGHREKVQMQGGGGRVAACGGCSACLKEQIL